MTKLILSGTAIIAAHPDVTTEDWGFATPDGHYPFTAGVDALVTVEDAPAGVGPGWGYADGVFTPPVPVEPPLSPVPDSISRRSLLIQMALDGLITREEAVSAAQTGALPALLDGVISGMPTDQALVARITWASMTVVPRNDALFLGLAAAIGMSEADLDAFFRRAGALP